MSSKAAVKNRTGARTTIAVQGARVHNLKNISVEIPRNKLIVVTGLSGSGKSSLAFDTIYAEGQRRYMESLSSLCQALRCTGCEARRGFHVRPVAGHLDRAENRRKQPAVHGRHDDRYRELSESPVATIGEAHCPRTGEPAPNRSVNQILEAILHLPEGAEVEMRAPVFKVYGEELDFVFTELRKKGCRHLIVDGKPVDLSEELELDETKIRHMDAVVDRFVVSARTRKQIKAGILGDAACRRRSDAVHVAERRDESRVRTGSAGRGQRHASTSSTATSSRTTSCSTIPKAHAGHAAASARTS